MTRRLLALLSLMILSLTTVAARPAQAPAITYRHYDVRFTLQEDGSFLVRETYVLRFDDTFSEGFAEIPTAYTDNVEILGFYEGETPYVLNGSGPGSYTVSAEAGALYIDWAYSPTTAGEERTFSVEYRVTGGLWVYDDAQILRWRAVPADRSGIPVEASEIVVELPPFINPQDVMALSGGATADVQYDGQRIVYTSGPIPDGTYLQIELTFPPKSFPITAAGWQKVEDARNLDYRVEQMLITFTIEPDGSVVVEERQTVNVLSGVLYGMERTISHRFVDSVEVLGVAEGDLAYQLTTSPCEGCYQVESSPTQPGWVTYNEWTKALEYSYYAIGETRVSWDFPPLREQRTTFTLRYRLRGVLRLTPDAQSLTWQAVLGGREVSIDAVQARVVLPPGVTAAQVKASGGEVTTAPDGALLITHGPLDSQAAWDVSFTLPPNATSATKAAWQQEVERLEIEVQKARQRQAILQIVTVVGSFLLFVGTAGGAFLAWYLWGRDVQVGAIADVLPRPPSDLPPGIVAYLLKEEATVKGALATLFHLGSLGLLTISFKGKDLFLQRTYNGQLTPGTPIQLNEQETVVITPHMATLFNALLPAIPPEGTTLSLIYGQFLAILPRVYEAMAQEADAFFAGRPERVRGTWRSIGALVLLGGLALLCVGISLLGRDMGSLACFPGLAVIVGSVGIFIIARWMPRRTSAGALEAAKWRAFQRFLQDLKRHADLPNAQYMLDRYFAYAVALDVEDVVIRHAAELGARPPLWMQPTIIEVRDNRMYPRRALWRTAEMAGAAGVATALGEGGALPTSKTMPDFSLQSMSDKLISAINNASNGLATVLTDATRTPGAPSTQAELDRILRTASGGGSSSYRSSSSSTSWSSSSSRSSWSSGSSRSSWSSGGSRSSGGFSSSRSSSSSHSGGGGRRGFR